MSNYVSRVGKSVPARGPVFSMLCVPPVVVSARVYNFPEQETNCQLSRKLYSLSQTFPLKSVFLFYMK